MIQQADGLGGSMKLQLAGMLVDIMGLMRPGRHPRQCSRGELWTQ